MAEAGDKAHREILATLNQTANDRDVAGLVKYAIPCNRATSRRDHLRRA
jgi:hypothetical protein